MRGSKFSVFVFSLVFALFTGCSFVMVAVFDMEDITVRAEDEGTYDFYKDDKLVCRNEKYCDIYHDKSDICRYVLEIRRGDVVYGRLYYGYWEERNFLVKMISDRDDKKCPGYTATIKIDQVVKAREEALERKRRKEEKEQNIARWQQSPLSSSSAEH